MLRNESGFLPPFFHPDSSFTCVSKPKKYSRKKKIEITEKLENIYRFLI